MAVKNHLLDEKIITSAMHEFMTYGYQAASINKIAAHAGVTTGAVYTRYQNKDDLFCSLLQAPLAEIAAHGTEIAEMYYRVKSKADFPLFLAAMQAEMQVYMDVIFKFYDSCILLYCKSEGSSAGRMLETSLRKKADTTIAFLEGISHKELPGVEFLLRQQFDLFKLILQSGYSKEKVHEAMSLIQQFQEAGWKEIFQTM